MDEINLLSLFLTIKIFQIFRITSAKNETVGKTPKKGQAKVKQEKDGKSIGKIYSAFV